MPIPDSHANRLPNLSYLQFRWCFGNIQRFLEELGVVEEGTIVFAIPITSVQILNSLPNRVPNL